MSDIVIIIAKKEGGLDAVVNGTGYRIIAGTQREFTSLATHSDPALKLFGKIYIGESGWFAFAELTHG